MRLVAVLVRMMVSLAIEPQVAAGMEVMAMAVAVGAETATLAESLVAQGAASLVEAPEGRQEE